MNFIIDDPSLRDLYEAQHGIELPNCTPNQFFNYLTI